MKPLDDFFENSYEIIRYFLKRILMTGLGHCLVKARSTREILNCLLPFSLTTFENTRDICIKQQEKTDRSSWVYEPKLKLILNLLKRFNLVKKENYMFYLWDKKIELTLPKHLLYLSEYYASFWRFCIILTSKLWLIKLFEYPCEISKEVLALIYNSLFFREQINMSLEKIIETQYYEKTNGLKLFFYPPSSFELYYHNKTFNTVSTNDPNDADLIVINNFLNDYSLLELRTLLKNKNFILIQPTKRTPLSAIPILYSKKSLPENIMLKVDYSPTPITFIKYY